MANPYAGDIETVDIGRFSTTLLNQTGARKRVRQVGGNNTNTFDNRRGDEYFAPASSVALSPTTLLKGSLPENTYTAVLGYFLSRGVTESNASTMATLLIDTARLRNESPLSLINDVTDSKTSLSPLAYPELNILRQTSNQQETISTINNSNSTKSRSIKA